MRLGINEKIWSDLSEDQRLFWTIVISAIGVIAGTLVQKTPYIIVNMILGVYVALNALLIIHSQRKLSSYSRSNRRRVTRYSATLFIIGIQALGISFFSSIGIEFIYSIVHSLTPLLFSFYGTEAVISFTLIISIFCTMLLALRYTYRNLEIHRLIITEPQRTFIKYVFSRPYQARSLADFAAIELAIVLYTYFFSSTVAVIVNNFQRILSS